MFSSCLKQKLRPQLYLQIALVFWPSPALFLHSDLAFKLLTYLYLEFSSFSSVFISNNLRHSDNAVMMMIIIIYNSIDFLLCCMYYDDLFISLTFRGIPRLSSKSISRSGIPNCQCLRFYMPLMCQLSSYTAFLLKGEMT